MAMMTETQAYAAMFHFLKELHDRTKCNDLGGFPGAMALLEDGSAVDPAMGRAWERAVEYALQGGKADSLMLG
jgi:hypothetical protein